jgi:hypothetical protein
VSAVKYDAGDVPFDLEARQRFNTKVAELYEKRMANAEVDTIVRAEEFEASYRPAQVFPNAAEGLKIDWPPIEYGVDRLVTKGGIVLITAGYKTGKTDLMFNLLRSYADETPFLGEFEVAPLDEGRQVMMLDFELDENYSWALLKMQQIQRPERANLITYRGRSFDIQNDEFRQRFTEMLVGLGVQVLIVDPFGAAFHGEENSNTEVRAWLEALKVVQAECGIREVFITTHTGRAVVEEGQERARGATALNDVVDVAWTYTRDEKAETDTPRNYRFLRALGRAVSVEDFAVEWNAENHHLTVVEGGGNRAVARVNSLKTKILQFVETNPGLSKNAIWKGIGTGRNPTFAMIDEMSDPDDAGHLLDMTPGPNKSQHYELSTAAQFAANKAKAAHTTV